MQIVPLDEVRPGDNVVLFDGASEVIDMPEVIRIETDRDIVIRDPKGERRINPGSVHAVVRVIPPPPGVMASSRGFGA